MAGTRPKTAKTRITCFIPGLSAAQFSLAGKRAKIDDYGVISGVDVKLLFKRALVGGAGRAQWTEGSLYRFGFWCGKARGIWHSIGCKRCADEHPADKLHKLGQARQANSRVNTRPTMDLACSGERGGDEASSGMMPGADCWCKFRCEPGAWTPKVGVCEKLINWLGGCQSPS